MRPIPSTFRKDQFDFRLLERSGDAVIYEKSKASYHGFEVMVVQSHDGYEMMGTKVPPSEFLPSNEQWGSLGFTFLGTQIDDARTRMSQLAGRPRKISLKLKRP